ncbi:MAG: hypothetical protein HY764_01140 [Candidatus Portnoybacteria bacterium]|nr:hypothetical protein [Candidatus Portnoybacteria bacterium]
MAGFKTKKYYSQPDYIGKSKKPKNRHWRVLIFWVVIIFFLAGGTAYLAIFSPILKVKKINLDGFSEAKAKEAQEIGNQILQKKFFNKIPKDNFVLLPEPEIRNSLLDNFPEIKKLSFVKDLRGHSISIKAEQRKPAAIWCRVLIPEPVLVAEGESNATSSEPIFSLADARIENCLFIDETGFAFAQAPILSGGEVPTVYSQTESVISIKDIAADSKILSFILNAKKELAVANLNLTDFVVQSKSIGDLEILAPDGWRIFLNIDNSVSSQINALKRVLNDEIKEKRPLLDYIDLRVENRAYYKLKNP